MSLPSGLFFVWWERKAGEEHQGYWGQLCGSMHRLVFVREEIQKVTLIADLDLALLRLNYHMENYLVRIYELRERAVKLLAAIACYKGSIGSLKDRKKRKDAVSKLSGINPDLQGRYLDLLSALDDDIDLRNQNTHDTFLSLELLIGHETYSPSDLLFEFQHQDLDEYRKLKKVLRSEIKKTVKLYTEKIQRIIDLTNLMLKESDFTKESGPELQ